MEGRYKENANGRINNRFMEEELDEGRRLCSDTLYVSLAREKSTYNWPRATYARFN